MSLFSKDQELTRRLSELRDKLAKQTGREGFKILQRVTIEEIAAQRPQTLDELSKIKGIGPKKLAEFGQRILEIVLGEDTSDLSDKSDVSDTTHKSYKTYMTYPSTALGINKTDEINETKEDETEGGAAKILTVSEFLDRVNNALREEDVSVMGEVTGLSPYPNAVYFSLKDKEDGSVMSCYMNLFLYRGLGVELTDGMEVKVGGFANVYKPKGRMSFLVQSLELVGAGALQKAYEVLKNKLELEGLFERKRELPQFIRRVGVITSKTGAVIDDFRNNLAELGLEVKLFDVRVEGAQAVPGILRALRWFQNHSAEFDVLVLMRGGGSLEDLQAFNHEGVVRAIFAARIPTICAIGHHRDVPLAALTGDFAPSTPTAAAHLVSATWDSLRETLPELENEMLSQFESWLTKSRGSIQTAVLRTMNFMSRVVNRAAEIERIILEKFGELLEKTGEAVHRAEKYLAAVSPERSLRLGYSIVFNSAGKVVRRGEDLKPGEVVRTKLHQGGFTSRVGEIEKVNSG